MSWIDELESHLLPCSLKLLSGRDCPGCGLQRAAIDLLRGDLLASLQHNASLLPLLCTLLFAALHLRFAFRRGPAVLVGLFVFTAAVMLVQYLVKLISNH